MAKTQAVAHEVERLQNYHDYTSPDNKLGLQIKVEIKSKSAFARVTIPQQMAGWRAEGATGAHPGAVATLLTTVMGQGVSYLAKRAAWIKSVSIDYLGLVPVGVPLRCETANLQARGDKEQFVDATISDDKGEVLARGRAEYQLFDMDELRAPHALLGLRQQLTCGKAFIAPFEKVTKAIP